MPPSTPPLSLLLKSSKSTFFLLLQPNTPFSELQSQLQTLLTSNVAHLPESLITPPSGPSSLKLGLPKDPADPKKGFVTLDEATYKNGKGTITSAGIKDNSVVAFMVVNDEGSWDGEFDVQWPADDYYDNSQSQSQGLK
ncbi:hypothetical protein ABW20_dc0101147 [Dactylellina cionopaga]|nr:hypothetical protein ABW20_dc0101147 [Dactylellina cionopaga]